MPRRQGCPSNDPPAATPTHFGTAWPNKSLPSTEWPITGVPAPPNRPLTDIAAIARERYCEPEPIRSVAPFRTCVVVDRSWTQERRAARIAHAQGMVCAQARCTLDEALRLMVDRAQRDHVRLDAIASAVIDGVMRFS